MSETTQTPKAWPKLSAFKAGFDAQRDFCRDPARFVLAGASVRSGKTYSAARKFLARVRKEAKADPHTLKTYWVIGPTSDEAIACKIELVDLIPMWQVDKTRQKNDNKWRDLKHGRGKVWLKGNVLIEFKSADRPEGLVARKINGVWWTEIARSKALAWPNVRSRLANTNGWLIADTSPYGRCWFYLELWEPTTLGKVPNASAHIWRAVDSPFIPPEEIEQARAMLPPQLFRREFEADWSTFKGLIYDEFDPAIHLRRLDFRPEKLGVFVDVNVASDMPAAFCVAAIAGKSPHERVHVLSEFYQKGIGVDGLGGYVDTIRAASLQAEAKYGVPSTIVIDPSAEYVRAKLVERGMNVVAAKNAVVEGIQRVMLVMHPINGVSRLTIDPSCTNMVNELSGYRWKVTADGVIREEPEKVDDHLMDGLRYGVMHFVRPYAPARQVR